MDFKASDTDLQWSLGRQKLYQENSLTFSERAEID